MIEPHTQSGPDPIPNTLAEPQIRVAVLKEVPEVRLDAPGALSITGMDGQELSPKHRTGMGCVINSIPGGLAINGVPHPGLRKLRLESTSMLLLASQELARTVDLYREPERGGLLTLVAHIPMERYLAGVLAGEVPYRRWGAEALKAQAIASRSYALYQMQQHAQDPYHVEASVMSQVFKPASEYPAVLTAAVHATRGLVLTCDGRLFSAYFHSTCGGRTAAAVSVFPGQTPLRTLAGVNCPYCTGSPSYRWQASLAKDELTRRLRRCPDLNGQPLDSVQSVLFTSSGASGRDNARAEQVLITHSGGRVTLPANRFRLAIGAGELKSVLIEAATERAEVIEFSGRGFGHGVGLCQYGSQGMAERGLSCEQILGHYYPGGDLTKFYGDPIGAL